MWDRLATHSKHAIMFTDKSRYWAVFHLSWIDQTSQKQIIFQKDVIALRKLRLPAFLSSSEEVKTSITVEKKLLKLYYFTGSLLCFGNNLFVLQRLRG